VPCVYVLTNPAIPGLIKIGYTAGSAADRAAQVSQGTGVPAPFQAVWFCQTISIEAAQSLERRVHTHCAAQRLTQAREFFRLNVEQAVEIIESLGYREGVIAITSPEIAARAEVEQARARAEAKARAEAETIRRAAENKARAEEIEVQERKDRIERARQEREARRRDEKLAMWMMGFAFLFFLYEGWIMGFLLLGVAYWIHPK